MNVVAHNLLAMNAQRQFGINTGSKAKSTEKLSSGYKINRAADDAAGLSISEKMRRQIRGLSQGVANTQDGVSLCQVADGALAEVNDMLHRITELSVKAANGTNSEQDRQYIQEEINQILQEIDRIGDTTTFNEQKIFTAPEVASDTIPVQEPVEQIQRTFAITGTPNNLASGTYTIVANNAGIEIGGDVLTWDSVVSDDGTAINPDNLQAGNYSFAYNGLDISFTVDENATFNDVIAAIDGATFDINKETNTYSVVSVTDCGVSPGTDTENFLSRNGTRYLYEGGYRVIADENGLYLADYPSQMKTWGQLGIDVDNPGGGTINFADTESGAYFSAQIAADATKEDVINAINGTKFYWGYIDMSTRENARLGYEATSITAETIRNSSAPLSSVKLTSFKEIYDELFDDLGYTTKSSKLDGLNVSVSISGTTRDDLKLTITAENGNSTDLSLYSWDPDIWEGYGYARPVFGYNRGAQITLHTTYGTLNPPTEEEAITYLGTLGELASNVSVPSPYYFKYKANSMVDETYSIDNINTVDRDNVNQNTDTGINQSSRNVWIQSGCETGDGMWVEIDNMNTSVLGIEDVDVSTADGATKAIDEVAGALRKVTANRSRIGAQQNRMEHTIANEENVVENTTVAESRIRDTDMARETVRFSNLNILSQAGQAMMAQANQSNQGVLNLLG